MKIEKNNCCLLIIDLQEKLLSHIFDYHKVLDFSEKIVDLFSFLRIPILYTEQYPKGLGGTIHSLKNKLDLIKCRRFEKTSFSAFEAPKLSVYLKKLKKKQIILVGIETHICILQTSFDLVNAGYKVFLVDESVGSRKLSDKEKGLQRMIQKSVDLINFEMLFFELLRDSNHKSFKELSNKFIK